MEQKIIYNLVDQFGNTISPSIDDIICNLNYCPITSSTSIKEPYDDVGLNPKYKNQLTKKEIEVIHDIFGTRSEYYRSDHPLKDTNGIKIWNQIVKRMPKYSGRNVYRYLNPYDNTNMQCGEIITIEHCLLTTIIGRKFMTPSKWVGKYIIKCKRRDTKAHDVSLLCQTFAMEKQVNFEVSSSFVVYDIKDVHCKKYIYMREI